MKIIKFGGKSLANGDALQHSLSIVVEKVKREEVFVLVVSARGNTTEQLLQLLSQAAGGNPFETNWDHFVKYQQHPNYDVDITTELQELKNLLEGVRLVGEFSKRIKDKVLSYGELISAKTVAGLLQTNTVNAQAIDAREFLLTDSNFGNALPNEEVSGKRSNEVLQPLLTQGIVPVVTGFIGADERGETTTIGRNGSNYTASLLANFLDADKVENYTNVSGVYTADPNQLPEARLIDQMSFDEVNEMVHFGANILHAKTLLPLIEKSIPIEIKSSFSTGDQTGTLITNESNQQEVKSLSVLNNKALITVEGRGLLGKVGVDARIFTAMADADISVGIISQGSSERGIGFVVDDEDAEKAVSALKTEFAHDFATYDMQQIKAQKGFSVLSIVGLALEHFALPFKALISNQVHPVLVNTAITGKNVSILIEEDEIQKAIQVIHGELFEESVPVYLALFGHGNVGGTLIEQIIQSKEDIQQRKKIHLVVACIANSRKMIFDKQGIGPDWEEQLEQSSIESSVDQLMEFVAKHHLGNLIVVDNTASDELVAHYPSFVEAGFDIVSSNKIFNCLPIQEYQALREQLAKHQKEYLYETNVGAGLPLIDTIQLLHVSGENITQIRGIFSGSLSYLFNHFSERDEDFSVILKEAIDAGFTEPDPRIDLSGMDVARKLLILARELDLTNNLEDVAVQNLIPEHLQTVSKEAFLEQLEELDAHFQQMKDDLAPDEVLRYIGDLSGDLSTEKGELTVQLVKVKKTSPLGQLKGSDSIFEIYTESYGKQPIIIQGSGAGAKVTARGVFGDILRLAQRSHKNKQL